MTPKDHLLTDLESEIEAWADASGIELNHLQAGGLAAHLSQFCNPVTPSDYKECPACNARMRYSFGMNFDYDAWECGECGNVIELSRTSYPEEWE